MQRLFGWTTILALLMTAGCRGPAGPADRNWPAAEAEPWRVVETDPRRETLAYLTNGYVGARIDRLGSGASANGQHPAFSIRHYQLDGEEKIVEIPNPFGVRWTVDDAPVTVERLIAYEQALDFRTGWLTTDFTIEARGVGPVRFRGVAVMHPNLPVVAQRWELMAAEPVRVKADLPHPGIPKGTGGFYRFEIPEGGAWLSSLRTDPPFAAGMPGPELHMDFHSETIVIERVLRLELDELAGEMRMARHGNAEGPLDPTVPELTFEEIADASATVWAWRWRTDIEIDGPVEDQQAVRSFLFYLRAGMNADAQEIFPMSVSPLGLSRQTYNGHVFWDADIWVFPALALVDPAAGRAIADYRLDTETVAARNFAPEEPPVGPIQYPWESSVTGRETAPYEPRQQIHITGSVAWMLSQAAALGLVSPEDAQRIRERAGAFFWARSVANEEGSRSLRGVMSPDEFHVGDDDLYTNLLAEWCLEGSARFYRARDDIGLLTYRNDALRGYKQAAAVLAIYPLQDPEAEAQAQSMLERFEDKVTPNGPAMSDAIHALIWARLGDRERAYATWRRSWEEFTQHPLLLFSEKRRSDVTYFTTGAGGCLQTVLFGFLGLRIDTRQEFDAQWSKRIANGMWLSARPQLPPAWTEVRFLNFTVGGESLSLTATQSGDVRVEPGTLSSQEPN